MPTPTQDLRTTLRQAMTTAMKARDRDSLAVTRSALAAIANAEAVPVDTMPRAGAIEAVAVGVGAADAARRELTEAQVRDIVAREAHEARRAAQEVGGIDAERARTLQAQADLLDNLLAQSRI